MILLAETNLQTIDAVAPWIPILPLIAMVLCGLLGLFKPWRKLSAWVAVAAIATSFVLSLTMWMSMGSFDQFAEATAAVDTPGFHDVKVFQWIAVGDFAANFGFFIDPLTIVMLMVVTGIGTLIAIYAAGYMDGDPGYFRFFAYVGLFIFSMTNVVMADNLLLLYLGWECVGLASFLLIGFYYRKHSAVAAAKKAFITNRVGDFGFALGIMGAFVVFGAINYGNIFELANPEYVQTLPGWKQSLLMAVPFLLMLGAFGKSAQIPLHVWLPDAMEGPTPVSALIHAATMVTSGVYMIARLLPVYELSPYALPTVAIVGGLTAFFGATIAVAQTDIKRVWAYSTVSQLGYMFLGVGTLTTLGGVFHLANHAFFKALLFLTAGNVMHAMAGQLDMRKMSGLIKKMPITAILMFCGAISLAGFPLTAGFISKDKILISALVHPTLSWLGWLALLTAMITAFYAFRLWFRIFLGPTKYEMGHEHHGYETEHTPDDHAHGPHEMPWWPMLAPLVVLAFGALFAGLLLGGDDGFMKTMISHSTAKVAESHGAHDHAAMTSAMLAADTDANHATDAGYAEGHAAHGGMDHDTAHYIVMYGGSVLVILSIALAAYLHWINRALGDRLARSMGPVLTFLRRKWYVDELYHYAIVMPLRGIGHLCFWVIDRVILDGLLINWIIGSTPSLAGRAQRPTQRGQLQGFAVLMIFGVIMLMTLLWILMRNEAELLGGWTPIEVQSMMTPQAPSQPVTMPGPGRS